MLARCPRRSTATPTRPRRTPRSLWLTPDAPVGTAVGAITLIPDGWLIDRAIGGHPGADLAADLAAINDSFGIITGQEAFSRARDHRMDYLDRLADA
jgi:hypothetical protein